MSLETRLQEIVRASPHLMDALTRIRALGLPQWRVFSGAVYQAVWNHQTGRDPAYGLKDYDLGYFDPDTSYEAEDVFIRRAAETLPPPLNDLVEVRNQARVHLWFAERFGEPYSALKTTDEALERFVAPAFSVAVRLEPDDGISIAAPFGLEDLFAMTLRPNPNRGLAKGWDKVVASARERWPDLTVVGP